MRNTKMIIVDGKKYTLTASRSLATTIASICPEILEIKPKGRSKEDVESIGSSFGLKLISNLDVLFFDMIRKAHPEISKEKSDEILDLFEDEYNDVMENLLNFAMSVFEQSTPNTSKKNLNW